MEYIIKLCERSRVACEARCVGDLPVWPEDLRASRCRFARRFLIYLRRSVRVRRNFLLVSHADCVGAALSMMPSQAGAVTEEVLPGGMFMALRSLNPQTDH